MRDLAKRAEQGEKRISESDTLSLVELYQLSDMAKSGGNDALYNALMTAFHAGYETGVKAAQRSRTRTTRKGAQVPV